MTTIYQDKNFKAQQASQEIRDASNKIFEIVTSVSDRPEDGVNMLLSIICKMGADFLEDHVTESDLDRMCDIMGKTIRGGIDLYRKEGKK